ncbi:MAG: hypothetical protein EXR37_00120 [Limnohabitans sp.]|nr:hypothetical protein [Limnohabitans sp.]
MKLRALLVGCLTVCSAAPVLSEPLNAEDRLEAIRQALVVRAMEGPTQVRASAFIDGHGVLREASSFVAGMEVRGIRVMAYGRDIDGQPKASGLNMDSKSHSADGCKTAGQAVAWHQMLWDSQVLNIPAGSQWEAQQVEQQFRKQALLLSKQAVSWRLNERKLLSDNYEQKLLGQGEQTVALQLKLSLAPSRDNSGEATTYVVHWELLSRSQGQAIYHAEQKITVNQPRLIPNSPKPLDAVVLTQIQASVQGFVQGMERALSCRVPQFEVIKVKSDSVRIAGGSNSGVKPGMFMVLTNKQQLPSRALEPRAFDSLAMGEVVSVSEYYAELKVKTSAKITGQSHWIAIPQIP